MHTGITLAKVELSIPGERADTPGDHLADAHHYPRPEEPNAENPA
jgi:hypothetical protein